MPAAFTTLYVDQGSTFNTTITLDDNYGNVYNLYNFSANSQIRKSYYSTNSTAVFATTINVANGTVLLSLSAPVTANIAAGRYVYDTVLTDNSNGSKLRILEGIVDVSPCVTR